MSMQVSQPHFDRSRAVGHKTITSVGIQRSAQPVSSERRQSIREGLQEALLTLDSHQKTIEKNEDFGTKTQGVEDTQVREFIKKLEGNVINPFRQLKNAFLKYFDKESYVTRKLEKLDKIVTKLDELVKKDSVLWSTDNKELAFRSIQAKVNVYIEELNSDPELQKKLQEKIGDLLKKIDKIEVPKTQFEALTDVGSLDAYEFKVGDSTFIINDKIGSGGFGAVYSVEDCDHPEKNLVLKVVHLNPNSTFDRVRALATLEEIYVMRDVQHPNIMGINAVAITSLDEPDPQMGVIMERAQHGTLTEYIGTLPQIEKRAALLQVYADAANGYTAMHARGLVHRDVKPDNILVGEALGRPVGKVSDFGLTKRAENLREGQIGGTPVYVAPDLMHTQKTDVYSLGMSLLESFSGKEIPQEFMGKTFEETVQLRGRLSVLDISEIAERQLPGEDRLQSLITSMIDPDPDARPSMEMVHRSLLAMQAAK